MEMEKVESESCLGIGEESSRGRKYRRIEILKLILRMVYETEYAAVIMEEEDSIIIIIKVTGKQ